MFVVIVAVVAAALVVGGGVMLLYFLDMHAKWKLVCMVAVNTK